MKIVERIRIVGLCGWLTLAACGDDDGGVQTAIDAGSGVDASSGSDATTASDSQVTTTDGSAGAQPANCTGTGPEKAVCAANAFLSTVPATTRSSINLAYSDFASRTMWSNLPGVTRAGVKIGTLDAASKAAALSMMATVLSADGNIDLTGVLNADDYLGSVGSSGGGGGPGGGGGSYSSSNYYVAVFGTPSATGNWALSFGGHHMAFNLTWHAGVGYPTPNHIGVEPKASFTINGTSFAPLTPEGDAFFAVFKALSSGELSSAYLGGTFSDVLIGPVEYMTGSTTAVKAKYPSGTNRKGVKVSALTTTQQALVVAAIKQWVNDYDASIADALVTEYTSSTALQDTLLGWGGTESRGVDPDVNGTYLRIDGPRLWLELSCQAGVVIANISHFHTIYRDKAYDYAGEF